MTRRRSGILFGLVIGGLVIVLLLLVLVVGLPALTTEGAMGPPHFVDEAPTAGLDHRYDGESDFFVGGGAAVFDCDADGLPDVYLAGGSLPAALYHNDSEIGGPLRFSARPDPATDLVAVTGAYPLDIDGDRVVDLAVLRHGENVLLRGVGDCRFEAASQAWGFDGGDAWTTAFSATWEAGASWPTIAIGNYVDAASTSPDRLCSDNELVRPSSDQAGFGLGVPLSPGWCSLSMLFSDWDRSGRSDLRVSNDRHYYSDAGPGEEQLWRIAVGESPRLYAADEGWQTIKIMGMGIAGYDVTGDGYPEYYLTSQADNKLQTLAGGSDEPRYEDIALERGVTATRPYAGGDTTLPSTAWHDAFEDVNNDTFIDLFVAKGNVEAQADYAALDPSNLFIGQPDGTFVEGAEAAGLVDYDRSRGAALADFNLDGMLDLLVVHRREPVGIWRNVGAGSEGRPTAQGNWIALQLTQSGGNTMAVGAWIEVKVGERTALREVTVGGGHVSGQAGWFHFGLGSAEGCEVRVTWPGGEVGPWQPVAANQFVAIGRGAAEPRRWAPGTPMDLP